MGGEAAAAEPATGAGPAAVPRRSLGTRLRIGLAFGALALALFVAFGVLSGTWVRQQAERDAGEALNALASRMSLTLETGLHERYREIQNLAAVEQAGLESAADLAQWRRLLDRIRVTLPHYAWVGLAGLDGRVLAASGGVLEGHDVGQREWFQRGREQPFVADVHEAKLLARYLAPAADGEPPRLLDVAAPVLRDGQVRGVLAAHLSWAWAGEERARLLSADDADRGVELFVIGAGGQPLLAPAQDPPTTLPLAELQALGGAARRVLRWPDGRDYVTALRRGSGQRDFAGLGWTVVARQPLAEATAPARGLQWRLWGLGLVGATLFGLVGWALAGWLAAPLRRVALQARAVLPHGGGGDEVRQLSNALGSLVQQLRERERELLALTGSLEQQVGQRTEALERSNEDLRQFVRMVSHDVKGPVRSVAALLRQLSDPRQAPLLAARADEMLQAAAAECERVGRLVDELMALSRVEAQALHAEPVEMQALVAAVLAELAPTLPQAQCAVGHLPLVRGDPGLLRQVWQNLLANALKFSARQPSPRVTVGAREDADEVVFWVGDNGAGFDPAQAERLFGVFQRLHTAQQFPGTGIGLSIVKRVVQRHGGRVWAEGEPGRGATFYFALPTVPVAPAG